MEGMESNSGSGTGVTETQGQASSAGDKEGAQAGSADDIEEIKIGSVSGKVPKSVAQAIKNLERGFQFKAQELAKERTAYQHERQQNQQLEQAMRANPKLFFQRYGIDPSEFAEMTLAEKLEAMQLSPEQKRLKELEARNQKWEEQEQRRQEWIRNQQMSQAEAQQKEVLDREIADAWKSSELPADPFYVKQIAAVMRDSFVLAKNGEIENPLTAAQAASIVKQRFDNFLSSLFGKMDPEGILKRMGEKKFNELREWDLKRVTSKAPASLSGSMQRQGHAPSSAEKKPNQPMSELEYRKYWLEAEKK